MGKSHRLLILAFLFYEGAIGNILIAGIEISPDLKSLGTANCSYNCYLAIPVIAHLSVRRRENVNSEALWWKAFRECGVAENECSPRHLMSPVGTNTGITVNTGMVLVAQLTWLACILWVSSQMSPPLRGRSCMFFWLSSTHCPLSLYCIALICSLMALIPIYNFHFIHLPTCLLDVSLTRMLAWCRQGSSSPLISHCLE